MKKAIVFLIFMSLPVVTSAQLKSQESSLDMRKILRYGMNPIGIFTGSFLNPEKFHMSQSYSIIMSNYAGQTIGQAMYLNTMRYQISTPLSFTMQWGYLMSQPLGSARGLGFNQGLPFNHGFFISGAQLKYTPTKNTEFKLEFNRLPYNYYSGWPYSRREF